MDFLKYQDSLSAIFTFMTLLHVLIMTGVSIRIITVRLPVTVALAWLILVFFLPLVGAVAYLVLGEKRLGRQYTDRTRHIRVRYDSWLRDLSAEIRSNPERLSPETRTLSRLTVTSAHIPALSGNRIQLLDAAEPILRSIIRDIDRANRFCHLEFYTWTEGGLADEEGAALLRSSGRGVTCRVLLDAIGSAQFLKGRLLAQLKAGGVDVAFALPVSAISVFRVRPDLRLHRKIVVVDDAAGYTGSFNLWTRAFSNRVPVSENGSMPWYASRARPSWHWTRFSGGTGKWRRAVIWTCRPKAEIPPPTCG
ncbi:MAG: phospholipase D-like domain-containing protein [Desulfobacterales bacterium]|jgi:cardiolipin synthase